MILKIITTAFFIIGMVALFMAMAKAGSNNG